MIPSAYGMRGERPLWIPVEDEEGIERLEGVPGTMIGREPDGQVYCAVPWDLWPVASACVNPGWRPPQLTREQLLTPLIGMDEYKFAFRTRKTLSLWKPQIKVAKWMAVRDYGQCYLAMRTGKLPISLAVATMRGCRTNLVIPPSKLRFQWTAEIKKWLPDAEVLQLRGRTGNEGRWEGDRLWIKDQENLWSSIRERQDQGKLVWIVCHLDIFSPQTIIAGDGQVYFDPKFPGFFHTIRRIPFDFVVADEAHKWKKPLGSKTKGLQRKARGHLIAHMIPTRLEAKNVWISTATPSSGRIKNFWQLWRAAAGKPVSPGSHRGSPTHKDPYLRWDRLPGQKARTATYDYLWGGEYWNFSERYCGGGHVKPDNPHCPVDLIWSDEGESHVEEFRSRKAQFCITRTAEEMSDGMPSVVRHLQLIDPGESKWKVSKATINQSATRTALKDRAAKWKCKNYVDKAIQDLESGKKIQVLVEGIKHAQVAAQELQKALGGRDKEAKELKKRTKVWTITSEDASAKQRDAWAAAFEAWTGPAAYITTAGMADGGFSLKGAEVVHVLQVSSRIDDHMQAEKRAAVMGANTLHVVYWAIAQSYDQVILKDLLDRLSRIAANEANPDADAIKACFEGMRKKEKLVLEQLASSQCDVLDLLGIE